MLFGLALVGPMAPYTFFGLGAVKVPWPFRVVYLISMLAISFTAVSYGPMAEVFPGSGLHLRLCILRAASGGRISAGSVMILDYLLMPMLCVIIAGVNCP